MIPRRWKGWSSGWLLGAASPGGMLRAAALPGAANQGPGTGAEMRPIAPIWSTHLSRPPHPRKPKKSSGRPNWSTPANLSKAIRSGTASAAVWGLRFQAGSELRCNCQFGKLPIPSKIWRRCISVATAAATSKWV